MLSKREKRAALLKDLESSFHCPQCGSSLVLFEAKSLRCTRGHSFDLAKQGHVYLLKKHNVSNYTKDLFAARSNVINSGIYDNMHNAIAEELPDSSLRLLDAGCGEGSHLIALRKKIKFSGIGADTAKAGIELAAKQDDQLLWLVADLADSPFQEHSFDVILNLFSPANYEEFKRISRNGGKIIKAVPGKDYLKEIRELTGEKAYDNAEVTAGFTRAFSNPGRKKLTYSFSVPKELRREILLMTPLSWKYKESEEIMKKAENLKAITIDVEILTAEL
ncbi:putative RNA methyltransferase [Alkalicoccus daliensis]|uniref:23S rRNA (Guanine745-N1)-methyltransferase n=1 Tax=Alkalicoccus daliensis TaxID=745820 RepID=A0A1H0HYP8_9BACI|nr:methyltransferase domain-containing protein [Alkalicoccus daliensis]SDO23951.1 23S rRNA (guanine745-N1)-methyltransferase [Alkalicoccus daliensis]